MTSNEAGDSTVVVTELVGHEVAGLVGLHPSPVHWATLVTVPVVDAGTVTWNDKVND